jgi:hypothetical protein
LGIAACGYAQDLQRPVGIQLIAAYHSSDRIIKVICIKSRYFWIEVFHIHKNIYPLGTSVKIKEKETYRRSEICVIKHRKPVIVVWEIGSIHAPKGVAHRTLCLRLRQAEYRR